MFKKVLMFFLISLVATSLQAQDGKEIESEDFLEQCQQRLLNHCWFKMSGKMNIRSASGERQKPMPLKCAAQLVPDKITFKATVNKTQSFKVENTFGGNKYDLKVLEDKLGENNGFDKVGIKPADLSLSFMYWDYIKEYEKDSLTLLQISCRVLLLGNPNSSQFVKVWLSEKHLGPMKVEWYDQKSLKTGKPLQTLSLKDFGEKNNVWLPLEFKITNSKGDLQIKFDEVDAEFSTKIPTDLYNTEN